KASCWRSRRTRTRQVKVSLDRKTAASPNAKDTNKRRGAVGAEAEIETEGRALHGTSKEAESGRGGTITAERLETSTGQFAVAVGRVMLWKLVGRTRFALPVADADTFADFAECIR